jgi:hypothetical protein
MKRKTPKKIKKEIIFVFFELLIIVLICNLGRGEIALETPQRESNLCRASRVLSAQGDKTET